MAAGYCESTWFVNRACSKQAVRTLTDWFFSPGSYNIIPGQSDVFRHIATGNLVELRALFARREASPFDSDE